jgi:hypothetical protein
MSRSTPNCTPRGARARALALIACAALTALPTAILAQNTLTPPAATAPLTAPGAGIPEAPVGHRQPRPSDLPPDVRREENANAPRQQQQEKSGLEGLPTICVRC